MGGDHFYFQSLLYVVGEGRFAGCVLSSGPHRL